MIFNLNALPGTYGDCLWIEYGTSSRLNRILIDGGTGSTKMEILKMISSLPEPEREFELLVVTHLDKDHIEGILSLLSDTTLGFKVKQIWFNAWQHLPGGQGADAFSAKQAEELSACIVRHGIPWNSSFEGKAVMVGDDELPVINLDGGMKFTLLSPSKEQLVALKPVWVRELLKLKLPPGYGVATPDDQIDRFSPDEPNVEALNQLPFTEDESEANASSIAFLAEYAGKTVLFTGDALPATVLNGLNRLAPSTKLKVDLYKLSHHASAGNTSPDLIKKLDCSKFLISTNGSIYHHPAPVTIARLIKLSSPNPELIFNYRSKYNEIWDSDGLRLIHKYRTSYPPAKGISINL